MRFFCNLNILFKYDSSTFIFLFPTSKTFTLHTLIKNFLYKFLPLSCCNAAPAVWTEKLVLRLHITSKRICMQAIQKLNSQSSRQITYKKWTQKKKRESKTKRGKKRQQNRVLKSQGNFRNQQKSFTHTRATHTHTRTHTHV